jgi:hypothetical protein
MSQLIDQYKLIKICEDETNHSQYKFPTVYKTLEIS